MKINVGSQNIVKVSAVKEVIENYDFLLNAEVFGLKISSQVSTQPKSLDETIHGAMNRAKNSFKDCNYSFGIEDGLM